MQTSCLSSSLSQFFFPRLLHLGFKSPRLNSLFATSLLSSSHLTLVLYSLLCPLLRLSFYLKLSVRFSRNCLLSHPVLSGYNESPDIRFSLGTTRLMSWPDGERCLRPLQSLVVSLLLSLVSLFSSLKLEAYCLLEVF